MMESTFLSQFVHSLISVLSPEVLWWIFLGVVIGILFGAAPGLTATTAVALFTPVTFYMSIDVSFGFLLGMYCGGYYAGSIPAILINTPGAPGNAATVLDGYAMAQKGKAGEALGHSVISSWFGGTISAFVLLIFAPIIGSFALKFGSAEYFSVGLLGLICVAAVSGVSLIKGVAGAIIGMLLGTIGMDPLEGVSRFTFDNINLSGGISLIPALVGLFAITELLAKVENLNTATGQIYAKITNALPNLHDYWTYKWTLLKSTVIGILIGALPGTGPTIASWFSYNEAKRASKTPEKFGTGTSEGIIACESSNNAVTGGALIPLLTLGVPGDTVTAILIGALLIQGITPGPMLMTENYGLVIHLLLILIIANIFMLIIGLLGSKVFPYILKIPMKVMVPLIMVFCVTGGYAANNSFFDVYILIVMGVLGFIALKFGFLIPPIVLGLVLGPIIEPNFRRALEGADMNPLIFITRPVSAAILLLAVVFVGFMYKKMNAPAK